MEKNNKINPNKKSTEKKTPKVQTDPYTAEVHQIMAKSEISASDVQRMQYLIEVKGAKLNSIGQDGKTILEKAVRHNSVELFQFFREHGADVNQVNGKLETPLHVAAHLKYAAMRDTILQANPNINAQDASGKTPLLIAVEENDLQGVSDLLAHKADPNVAAKGGEVPLTEVMDPQIGHELLQHGARVNVATKEGKDPLTQAENLQDEKLMAEILEAKLKEEKHMADQNSDVQHKEETQEKEIKEANQLNGPVDEKYKQKEPEQQKEEGQEESENSQPGNSNNQEENSNQNNPKANQTTEEKVSGLASNHRLSQALTNAAQHSDADKNKKMPDKSKNVDPQVFKAYKEKQGNLQGAA